MSALDQAFIRAYSREREPQRAEHGPSAGWDDAGFAPTAAPGLDGAQALRFDFGAGAVPAPIGPIWPWAAPAIPPGYHPGLPQGYYGYGPALPVAPQGVNPIMPAWGPWSQPGAWVPPVAPSPPAPRAPEPRRPAPAASAPASNVIVSYAGEPSADVEEPSLAMGPVVVQSTFEEELISPALRSNGNGAAARPAVALAQDPCCVPRSAAEQARPAAPVAPLAWEPTRDAAPAAAKRPEARFHPHWEVEQFAWPAACDQLLAAQEGAFAGLLERIVLAAVNGQKIVAVAGCSAGDGKSTLALCLAREAARAGLSTALVDADFDRPRLAELLGVDPPRGWEEALAGEMPLVETSISSEVEGVHLVPLRPGRAAPSEERTAALLEALELLSDRHDLVLVDMGTIPVDGTPAEAPTPASEKLLGAILVRDCRRVNEAMSLLVAQQLRAAGVEVLGRVDNFR
jgi:Mrp family chromosome partitioning ATPase